MLPLSTFSRTLPLAHVTLPPPRALSQPGRPICLNHRKHCPPDKCYENQVRYPVDKYVSGG